jgi:hypothetical protein
MELERISVGEALRDICIGNFVIAPIGISLLQAPLMPATSIGWLYLFTNFLPLLGAYGLWAVFVGLPQRKPRTKKTSLYDVLEFVVLLAAGFIYFWLFDHCFDLIYPDFKTIHFKPM